MYSTQLSHGLDQLGDHYDPIIIIGGPWGSQPRLGRDVKSFDNSTWEMMHGLLDTVQALFTVQVELFQLTKNLTTKRKYCTVISA
jgi:hypothetical protein